jgi:hypothetical protein
MWWVLYFLILVVFLFSKSYFFDKKNKKNIGIIGIYLIWNAVCIVRGMFAAEIYWDWKALTGNSMALILPIVAYSATNKLIAQSILSFYVKYALPLFLLFTILIRPDAYGFYLMPMSFLLLFLPALTMRQRFVLFLVMAIVIVADLGARSNVIKFGVPVVMLAIYYLRKQIPVKALETVRILFFVLPILLFVLGVTRTFNVFKMDEYIEGEFTAVGTDLDGGRSEVDILSDTRTFIYEEVLLSAVANNYWLFGRTPARGNDSLTFGVIESEWTGRNERLANEVALANVFTWTGIVGVILYMLVFFRASYLAVNRSKNIYAKILGIYVAFRWLYAWVEDVNDFSLNYFMLWIMIGLCFSYTFREMTNKDVLIWVRGIFDARYIRFQNHLVKKLKYETNTNINTPKNMIITSSLKLDICSLWHSTSKLALCSYSLIANSSIHRNKRIKKSYEKSAGSRLIDVPQQES